MDDIKVRLKDRALTDSDIKVVGVILVTYQAIQEQLEHAKLTMRRLKRMLGFKTETKPKQPDAPDPTDISTPDGDHEETSPKKQ